MDANGNTVSAEVTDDVVGTTETVSDAYNFENRLVRRDRPDGAVNEVLYDGDGDRVAKSVISAAGETNTTWYLVDRNNLTGYAQVVEERSPVSGLQSPVCTCVYTYGLDLISQDRWDGVSQWNVSFYGYDGHGNVRFLTDDVGIVTDTYTFDAFGKLIAQEVLDPVSNLLEPVTTANRSLVSDNHYLYCGEQYDADLQMYFLRARYMDTDRGRFWTMDTFEGRNHDPATLHKYLYVHADPVNGLDPSGNVGYVEIALVSGIIAAFSSYAMLNHLFLYTQARLPAYERNFELAAKGVVLEDFYAPVRESVDEMKDEIASELRANYVYGPILESLGATLEAVRLLRFASDVDEAMALPRDIRSAQRIMQKMGYKWLPNKNNPYVGGNWVRPAGKRDTLPPPHKAYTLYKKWVMEAS